MRYGLVLLGLALLFLWVVGLVVDAPQPLVWLDFVGALTALSVSLLPRGETLRAVPLAVGMILLVAGVIGLSVHPSPSSWLMLALGALAGAIGLAPAVAERHRTVDALDAHLPPLRRAIRPRGWDAWLLGDHT